MNLLSPSYLICIFAIVFHCNCFYKVAKASQSPTSQPTRMPTGQPTRLPYSHPTSQPSRKPSHQPSSRPSSYPTTQPSKQPYERPTGQPSRSPSSQPSAMPTTQPSAIPSKQPYERPTSQPSRSPSSQPSAMPSNQPTKQPSRRPTSQPSAFPSRQPSLQPTQQPFSSPSAAPTSQPSASPTRKPSNQPTHQPSVVPSHQPTRQPSHQPTDQPSHRPSTQPTSQPSHSPTTQPSKQPYQRPSSQPSVVPSHQPTRQPTHQPTDQPSHQPSAQPTSQPSHSPTAQPSKQPYQRPSSQPSVMPSSQPTRQPSHQPTDQPSHQPSAQPTSQPSHSPTMQPSKQPYQRPSSQPSVMPSSQPTRQPTRQPTMQPTRQPFSKPTYVPMGFPSSQPSRSPTHQPTRQPTRQPTSQPSAQPVFRPTAQPSHQPSSQPSKQPYQRPTSQPSSYPSSQPSAPTHSPTAAPTNMYGEFVQTSAIFANWSSVSSSNSGDVLVAVVFGGSIYVSTSYGSSFVLTDAPLNNWIATVSDSSGSILYAISSDGDFVRSTGGVPTVWSTSITTTTTIASSSSTSTSSHYNNIASTSTAEWTSIACSSSGQWVYIASSTGIVLLSNNSGVSWSSSSVYFAESQIHSIACDSSGQYVVFVTQSSGIFTSNNFGHSFDFSTMSSIKGWYSVASSSSGQLLVAVVYGGGIYTSTNYGVDWVETNAFPFADWVDVTCDDNCQNMYAIIENGGIYSSTDYGSTWQCVSGETAVSWSCIASSGNGAIITAAVMGGSIFMPSSVKPVVTDDDDDNEIQDVDDTDDTSVPKVNLTEEVVATIVAVVLGLLSLFTGAISVLIRNKDEKFVSKLGSTSSLLMAIGLASLNIATTFYNIIAPSVSTSSGGYITLVLSKIIVFIGWCIFIASFLFPQPDKSGAHRVPLSMLYHKPSLLKTYNLGGKIPVKHMQVYAIVLILSALDLPQVRLLPWLKTNFSVASNGYPEMISLRVSMYGQFLASLTQSIASIIAILSKKEDAESVKIQDVVLVVVSILQLLWSFFSLVLYIQAARSNSLKLVVVNEADLANIKALEESEHSNELNDDYSPKAISDTLNKQLKQENVQDNVQAVEMIQIQNPLFSTQIFSSEPDLPDLQTGDKQTNTSGYRSTIKNADSYVEVLKQQLTDHGIRPVEFIPLNDIKTELAELFEKANAGLPYDEARLDHMLLCMDLNPDFRAEKEVENRKWRQKVLRFLKECLEEMRGYIPPHIFSSSINSMIDEHISKDLAKRLINKKCLWLIRMSRRDIERTHEAELSGRFNPSGQGLDIIELAAVYVALPEKFFNDSSGKKQKWRENIEQQFKSMFNDFQAGKLPKDKERNFAYKGNGPMFTGRETLHESGTVSSEGVFAPRQSYMTMARPGIVASSSSAIQQASVFKRSSSHIPEIFKSDGGGGGGGDSDEDADVERGIQRNRELSVISEGSERGSTSSTQSSSRGSRKGSAFSLTLEGLLTKRFSKTTDKTDLNVSTSGSSSSK